MTRFLLALCLLACAGCATTNGGEPEKLRSREPVARLEDRVKDGPLWNPAATTADSAWLTFTMPTHGSYGCEPDTTLPLRGGMTVRVLRLNTVPPPFYRSGIEADSAGWDSVRAFNVPQEVARLAGRAPGERCSVRVGAGQYITPVDGQRCPAWRVVRVGN